MRRWILGAPALLLLLAPALPRPAGDEPLQVPGATWSPQGYEDRVLGFRLDRPPAPWEVRNWNGNWGGPLPPVVAFADPTGAILAVYAKDAAGGTAAQCAGPLASALHLPAPAPTAIREAEIAGEPAVAFAATGTPKPGHFPVQAFVSVMVKEGVCYGLAAYADGKDRPPVLSKILENRFRLLDSGDFRRARPPLDVEGAGWRTRGGTAEHAFVGVRLPLGPGWRLALDPRIPTSVALPSLNLDCPFLGAGIRLQGVALTGDSWEALEEAAEADFGMRYARLKEEAWIKYDVEGSTVTLTWRLARTKGSETGDSKRFALCGTLRGDGRLIMVEILHPTTEDPRVPVAIGDALERLRVLGPEERLALVAALGVQADTQAYMGREEFVRKGVYTSWAHRIVWRKPSPLWTFIPHEAMRDPQHSLAVLQDEEHGTNARLLYVEPDGTETKWTLHQRVVDSLLRLWPGTSASKAVPASLGSRDAVRTDLRARFAGIPLKVVLLTTNPAAHRAYAFVGVAREDPGAETVLDAAVKGLRFQVDEIPGPRRTARGFEDPGYGFRVDGPPGPGRVESLPVNFTPTGGRVVSVEAGEDRLVAAVREWPLGEPGLERSAVARVLAQLDPAGASSGRFAAETDVPGTLGGLPSRDLVYPGTPAIRVARVRVAGTLYVVGASTTAAGKEPSAFAWFRFAE